MPGALPVIATMGTWPSVLRRGNRITLVEAHLPGVPPGQTQVHSALVSLRTSAACLHLKVEAFVLPSPLRGWGGKSVGWGISVPLPPSHPKPQPSAGCHFCFICLQTSTSHLSLFMMEPHSLSNVKCKKIKLMKWMTHEMSPRGQTGSLGTLKCVVTT